MRYFITISLLLCCLLTSPPTRASELRGVDSVTVLAASSLTNVISELANIYTRKSGIAVSIAFDSSFAMAMQIIDGEPADIYI